MKDNKLLIVIVGISILLFIGLLFVARNSKSINWIPTFINTDTNPYGTYITYELMQDIFDKKIEMTRKPIYNNLKPRMEEFFYYEDELEDDEYEYGYNSDTSASEEGVEYDEDPMSIFDDVELTDTTAYVFINRKFELDESGAKLNLDLQYLLDFVGVGNNVFISAEYFSPRLLDTLGLETAQRSLLSDSIYTLVDYPAKNYSFRSVFFDARFKTDSCNFPVRVLAQNKGKEPVFIRVGYGKGYFYLHSIPSAYTNVNQLEIPKYDFAYRCLSYIPASNHVIWDEYQKQGLVGERSIFRVLLNDDALRMSLYLTLLGFLLFMIFRAKRIQRVIPIIKPPVNSSIEFLDTISNLYYHKDDFDTIVDKRQAYFLDYIRRHYYMPTERIDKDFIESLSAKSGLEADKLNDIFVHYQNMRGQFAPVITNDIFLAYNRLLEEFYTKVKLINK